MGEGVSKATNTEVIHTCHTPILLTRRVISLISTGASLLALSFLCTHRKLISTVLMDESITRILMGGSNETIR